MNYVMPITYTIWLLFVYSESLLISLFESIWLQHYELNVSNNLGWKRLPTPPVQTEEWANCHASISEDVRMSLVFGIQRLIKTTNETIENYHNKEGEYNGCLYIYNCPSLCFCVFTATRSLTRGYFEVVHYSSRKKTGDEHLLIIESLINQYSRSWIIRISYELLEIQTDFFTGLLNS